MGSTSDMDIDNVDILIIGAGLSGINAGYRIQKELPHKSFAILEGRSEVGGTWSFWKYPGIRSDSTMRVFGLPWYPWPNNVVMADGPVIRQYLEDAATSQGLDRKIHLNHKVTSCDWSSAENCWTLSISVLNSTDGTIIGQKKIKANWIINAAGYYSYEKPLPVSIPGLETFSGRVIHPQFWDSDGKEVDFSNKRVVIIGSGATAITLLPAIAKTAAKVTLLQRSPSYVFSLDSQDHNLDFWARFLPDSWAKTLHWWQCLIMESFFRVLLSNLLVGKRLVQAEMRKQLPPGFDLETHFNPSYPPFEQRLCFCPDGDFFKALSQPNTEIVTGTIETVTSSGIDLNPGAKSSSTGSSSNVDTLPCDMIITATGLYVDIISSLQISVSTLPSDPTYSRPDSERFNLTPEILSSLQTWNGTMIESLPNQGKIVGYTAGTWTPGANVRTSQIINVIKHMDFVGAKRVFPVVEKKEEMEKKPVMPNSSSYLVDARSRLPIAAGKGPWRNAQSVWADWVGIWRTWVPVRVAGLFGVRMGVSGLRFLGGEGDNNLNMSTEGRKDR